MKDKIIAWIKEQVKNAGAKGCVFGLSGGVDSAVAGALCKKAFPDNVLGLLLPCYSNEQDLNDSRTVAEKFGIATKMIDLRPVFNELYLQLEGKAYEGKEMSPAIANLKPRLRMSSLYYQANKLNYLVVGTGNRSESVMGYCTKYGDAGVDILPLASLLKTQVRKLAKELGVPENIIAKAPSAGLWPGQTDEGEMGITYNELDSVILGLEKGKVKELDKKLVEKIKQAMARSRHKCEPPPIFIP